MIIGFADQSVDGWYICIGSSTIGVDFFYIR
jgi:hypothetical protein